MHLPSAPPPEMEVGVEESVVVVVEELGWSEWKGMVDGVHRDGEGDRDGDASLCHC